MNDFLGRTVEVGDNVVLLKTPIVGEHTFKIGKVVKMSAKKVLVEVFGRPDRYSDDCLHKVWRYTSQLIKTNVEFIEDEKH